MNTAFTVFSLAVGFGGIVWSTVEAIRRADAVMEAKEALRSLRTAKELAAIATKQRDEIQRSAEALARSWDTCEKDKRRKLAQARHQRDMARLALTDAHQSLVVLRSHVPEGWDRGHKMVHQIVGMCERGLTLSAQDDQPEAGR